MSNTSAPTTHATSPVSNFRAIEVLLSQHLDPFGVAIVMLAITGVYIDLKPVAFEHLHRDQAEGADFALLQSLLLPLGITAINNDDTWYFSKQPALIAELRAAFGVWYIAHNAQEDAANRKIGQLLGYPETAIKYFIQRSHSGDLSQPANTNNGRTSIQSTPDYTKLNHYIHSPDHLAAEYRQYEAPLYHAMSKYCPSSLATLLST